MLKLKEQYDLIASERKKRFLLSLSQAQWWQQLTNTHFRPEAQ